VTMRGAASAGLHITDRPAATAPAR
jgi:hypothetical protein